MSRPPWILAALCALAILLTPAAASAAPPAPSPGPEGGTAELAQQLDAANRAYIDAQNALDASHRRQAELAAQQAELERRYDRLSADTETITVAAYTNGGGMRDLAAVLDSPTPGVFADRVSILELVARRQNEQLRKVAAVRDQLAATKAAMDAEVARQQDQLAVMAEQKAEVEAALVAAQNLEAQLDLDAAATASGTAPAVNAAPAPRRADGSWPAETCSLPDPTTKGCLTPRTLHALQQVRLAGFGHFVSCWRPPGQPYEHPKGRACDFAADPDGFGGVATGAARDYGTALATWLVRNAEALGVMYVIWFHQIWTPAAGWHAYRSGNGDPSSDHTNHVHLSIY
ncbi:coiled-coil domain-containing protein [Dactylosporangium sp. CA-092794]|uniref:coiled-coil domain-containing protein n=1 Tax=Dactylosporangium sp. CA-092794 TaxID=3239929 RepID=UPI003D8CE7CC